jgi:hypothetical protein
MECIMPCQTNQPTDQQTNKQTKSAKECFQRWTCYLSPPRKNLNKRRFTIEEDAIIFHAVQIAHPAKPCWTDICKALSSLSDASQSSERPPRADADADPDAKEEHDPHRIRERWHNILNPKLNRMPFSKAEDVKLYEGLREHGQKWTLISKDFFDATRSDIQLKNRFKTLAFQQFYAKVSARVLQQQKMERIRARVGGNGSGGLSEGLDRQAQDLESNANDSTVRGASEIVDDVQMQQQQQQSEQDQNAKQIGDSIDNQNAIAERLQKSLAAQIQGEDVPKPPPGQYFTPMGAAQILSRIGKSERRTVMKVWIDRNYVPVNLTSLYRTLGRFNSGKKLKPRWYCEGRMKSDTTLTS